MKSVILDTSFILTCIRNKIDFFREISEKGFAIIIPREVKEEIKRVANSRKKLKFREEAQIALLLLKIHKFKKINIRKKSVDKGLIEYALKNPNVIVATLDKEIQNKLPISKLIIRGKKKLELQ